MTELAHTQCNLPWLERENRVGAKKCLGASTTINSDIEDCLRIGEEIRGDRLSLYLEFLLVLDVMHVW